MTRETAKKLVYSDIDALRFTTATTAETFHARTDSLERWIGTASKKQLLAEIIYLLANNRKAD
jgi:hypothetical protein